MSCKTSENNGRICTSLMTIMVVVIAVILCMITLVAFWNLESAGEKITNVVNQAMSSVVGPGPTQKGKEALYGAIEKLKVVSNECLQAHTIAFLFQIFSVGLLSAGLYILEQNRKKAKSIDNRVEEIRHRTLEPISVLSSATTCITLINQALTAVGALSRLVKKVDTTAFNNCAVLARETLNILQDKLREMDQQKREIDKEHHKTLLDQIANVLTGLKDVPPVKQKDIQDIKEKANACQYILKKYKWIISYEDFARKYTHGGKLKLELAI